MLTALTIRNYTLVEHLEIDFSSGMTAITGETGAGKSLMVDALGLALGDRADSDRIRQGVDKAEIAALFDIARLPAAQRWLTDNDFDTADEALLRRQFSREGRSRGNINGQPATMQQLQALGDLLIDIHGQHAHQSLLRREHHRLLLDEFAGAAAQAEAMANSYREWADAAQKLTRLESQGESIAARVELLTFQLEEFQRLDLQPGEVESLEKELQVLSHAEDILRDSQQLLNLCREDEQFSLSAALSQALQLLHALPQKPPLLQEAEELLENARIQVEEATHSLDRHLDSFELDPARLEVVNQRLSATFDLARKHRCPPGQLLEVWQSLSAELADISGDDQDVDALRGRIAKLEQECLALGEKLTAKRRKAASRLEKRVNAQLAELAMSNARLSVALTPATKGFTRHGREDVELLITTVPGSPPRPLARVASGGELSRISLAIEVVTAEHSTIPTLVFDEVDVGIGGATAEIIGRLLRRLGERGQVVCVTHLPQVAAQAHQHYRANKSNRAAKQGDARQLVSNLDYLDSDERIEEIARMLGGVKITDQTLAHAREMLAVE